MTTDGIDPKLLRLANALSFMAYTGFVLALPPALAGRYWATVTRLTEQMLAGSLNAWADETADTAQLVKEVMSR
jgi:hypothetical protein